MYERLLVPEALPTDVERFIYLDADMLATDGIEYLWKVDLGEAILGAVQDLAVPLVSSPMGILRFEDYGFARSDAYFNAGVYVVDVRAWREHDIGTVALDYLGLRGDAVNLLDQEALNVAIGGRWKALGYRWNVIAGIAGRSFHQPRGMDREELAQAIESPAILHFAGSLKPWILGRLASRWATTYRNELHAVFPEHRYDESIGSRCRSMYDRRLRQYLYHLETFLWRKKGGF